MSSFIEHYDAATETLWVYRPLPTPTSPLGSGELKRQMAALKAGRTDQDQPLKHVHYVFETKEAAAHHSQALAFARIGTWIGDQTHAQPYVSPDGTPEFGVQDDFGIK